MSGRSGAIDGPVFISYATPDRAAAVKVCSTLEGRGVKCWIAQRDIPPGANYQDVIVSTIQSARAMVLVFSNHANQSEEIKKEVALAGRSAVVVIPLRLENVEPRGGLAYEFSIRQYIEAFNGWDEAMASLVYRIREESGSRSLALHDRGSRRRGMRRWIALAGVLVVLGSGVYYIFGPGHSTNAWRPSPVAPPAPPPYATGASGDDKGAVIGGMPPSMSSQETGNPIDYFPLVPGTTWTYLIQIGAAEPTKYEEVEWPMGQGGVLSASRGRFAPAMDGKRTQFTLILRVKGPAARQGGLRYPIGAEVEILRDDLGVFFDANEHSGDPRPKTLFFAATNDSRFEALLVLPHDPDEPDAPNHGGWGQGPTEPGYSLRVFFFGGRPGTGIGLGKQPNDELIYLGMSAVPGSSGEQGLHFMRRVNPAKPQPGEQHPASDSESDILNQGFTEDVWFERGRGLVRMIQRRGDTVTMTWTLTQFSP